MFGVVALIIGVIYIWIIAIQTVMGWFGTSTRAQDENNYLEYTERMARDDSALAAARAWCDIHGGSYSRVNSGYMWIGDNGKTKLFRV